MATRGESERGQRGAQIDTPLAAPVDATHLYVVTPLRNMMGMARGVQARGGGGDADFSSDSLDGAPALATQRHGRVGPVAPHVNERSQFMRPVHAHKLRARAHCAVSLLAHGTGLFSGTGVADEAVHAAVGAGYYQATL